MNNPIQEEIQLNDYQKQLLGTKTPEQTEPLPEKTSEKPEKVERRKIPWETLKGIIDQIGYNIANDPKATIEQKIDGWVELLKWAIDLVPEDQKPRMQESIDNPNQWDFIEKPKRKKEK